MSRVTPSTVGGDSWLIFSATIRHIKNLMIGLLVLMSSFKWYYMHVSRVLIVGIMVENIIIKN